MKKIAFWVIIVALLILPAYIILSRSRNSISSSASEEIQYNLAFPINQFKERITKIPFGLYVSPENSPVGSKRFIGFHTAVDVEYEDVVDDVPVFAINDGIITLSREAAGYGGVFILETEIGGQPHSALYGHIRPSSLPKVGQSFKKGDFLALLGTGYSPQTDNERRHLHFAILKDNGSNILGYVKNEAELSGWINPLLFY